MSKEATEPIPNETTWASALLTKWLASLTEQERDHVSACEPWMGGDPLDVYCFVARNEDLVRAAESLRALIESELREGAEAKATIVAHDAEEFPFRSSHTLDEVRARFGLPAKGIRP